MRPIAIAIVMLGVATTARAQQRPSGPPLQLGALHRAAEASDPRTREIELLQQQWNRRDQNVSVLWRPTLNVEMQAQYQTDVPTSPFSDPEGRPIFEAPKATYDTFLRIDQRLFDRTLSPQAAVQRAQLAEDQARVRSSLFALRQQVNDAFFAVAALDQRAGVLAAAVAELEARLRETSARVNAGTAIPADAAAIEASILQRQQEDDELRSSRGAALERLATLVGRPLDSASVPILPDLASVAQRAREQGVAAKARPEFAQFDRTRERLQQQRQAATAQNQPRINAFGRVGYARPGLNFIADTWDTYALGGVRLQWNTWAWGTPTRESEIAALQTQIVTAEEEAFARTLTQQTTTDTASIDRLERAIATDRRIVDLRQQVEQSARARLQEGVMTAAEYVSRETELLQARYAQASHEVDLAQARARLLTTLGVEVP
jgi:outer membrane protein TolC